MAQVRVMADVRINMNQFDNLADNVPNAVAKSLQEISKEALQIAVDSSRVDTGAMSGIKRAPELNAGWRRSQIGYKGTIKANNQNPGYRIYNNTVNKAGQTYTQYHEYGTEDFPAQPMAQPAVDYMNQMLGDKVLDEINDAIGKSISGVGINIAGPMEVPLPRKKR